MNETNFIKFLESCKAGGLNTLGDLVEAQKERAEMGSVAREKYKLKMDYTILELMTGEIESRMRSGMADINDILLWADCQRRQIDNILIAEKWLKATRRSHEDNK